MSSSTSSHQRNRSRTSPKQLFQVVKLRKKVLRTTVSPLMEVESDFGPSQTPTASNNATHVIVQVSFPPNLVPREKRPGDEVAFHQDTSPLRAIVHINRKLELQPVAEVTATTFTKPVTISSSSQVAFHRLATLRFCWILTLKTHRATLKQQNLLRTFTTNFLFTIILFWMWIT